MVPNSNNKTFWPVRWSMTLFLKLLIDNDHNKIFRREFKEPNVPFKTPTRKKNLTKRLTPFHLKALSDHDNKNSELWRKNSYFMLDKNKDIELQSEFYICLLFWMDLYNEANCVWTGETKWYMNIYGNYRILIYNCIGPVMIGRSST